MPALLVNKDNNYGQEGSLCFEYRNAGAARLTKISYKDGNVHVNINDKEQPKAVLYFYAIREDLLLYAESL
jgi:hypothetical protein